MKSVQILIIMICSLQIALGQHSKEYYSKIINYATEEINKNPENERYYLARAEARYEIGDEVNTLKDFNKTIALNSRNIEAFFHRGYLFYQEKKLDSAENDFKRILILKKKYPQAAALIGIIEQLKTNYYSAIEYFNLSIKDSISYTDSYYNSGLCYMALRNYSMAIDNFDKVIKLNNEINAYANKAYCYALLKNFKEADEVIGVVYKRDSTNGTVLEYMASISIEKKNYKLACKLFNNSLKHGNNDVMDSLKKYCK